MHHLLHLIPALLICAMLLTTGCNPSSRTTQDVQPDMPPATQPSEHSQDVPESIQPRDIEASQQFFASRVAWPEFDSKAPIYAIESGSNDDGAWFEGKGFFHLSIDDILQDMGDPMIMGPSNVTQTLTRRNSSGDAANQQYDLHVEMNYIMTVEFDLTVQINTTNDAIHYESHKTAGTSLIKRIDEIIEVQALPDGWCSISFQSRYDALVVKEKETRQHFEDLFARWAR